MSASYKRLSSVLLTAFCVVVLSLHTNSTAWFRTKLASHYVNKGELVRAVQLYRKIIRKDRVKGELTGENFVKINFDLAYLYGKLNFPNLAIESYAYGGSKFLQIDLSKYYTKTDLARDRLLAIGLLEAGKPDASTSEFRKLKILYPNFQDAGKYIKASEDLQKRHIAPGGEIFYFDIGDSYIENQLFDEARDFFTKRILDYGAEPVTVLRYLQKKYGANDEIKHKVWGDEIYVALEDFEKLEPQLVRWYSDMKVAEHYITIDTARKGNRSEFLEAVDHTENDRYLWVKGVNIVLNDKSIKLGVRVFVKSSKPPVPQFLFDVVYPKYKPLKSGVYASFCGRDAGKGWEEQRAEDLFVMADNVRAGWDPKDMYIDKIIFHIDKIPSRLYIDDIELYVMN